MRRSLLLMTCALAFAVAAPTFAADDKPRSALDFKVTDIDGKPVDLKDYKGKVVLIVNTASKCGLTPQYSALEKLYDQHKDKGFVILAFPANDFRGQEPGSNAEIKQFCSDKYDVSFPIMSKSAVTGGEKAPLYQFLTSKESNPKFGGEIQWNFTKFLIDRNGNVVNRFEPKVKPDDQQVTSAIEAEISKKPAA